jgi:hypothetical protein
MRETSRDRSFGLGHVDDDAAGYSRGYPAISRVNHRAGEPISRITNGLQMGYKWVTCGLQMGYKWVTNGLQMGYK